MKKTWIKLKEDPFLRVSLTWALGITGMIMVLSWAQLQLKDDNFDRIIFDLVPMLFVLFGAAYMVRFIGRNPVRYTLLCGIFVAIFMAGLGLINDLMSGLSWEAFFRFAWVAAYRSIGMAAMGALGGWVMTRGRVPIEIELPDKKELDAAQREGREEPAPRIITPVAAMPGSLSANTALLEQLERDPAALIAADKKQKSASRIGKKQK